MESRYFDLLAYARDSIARRIKRPQHVKPAQHFGFVTTHESGPLKREWRQLKRRIGARQAIKQRKAERRAAKSTRFEV